MSFQEGYAKAVDDAIKTVDAAIERSRHNLCVLVNLQNRKKNVSSTALGALAAYDTLYISIREALLKLEGDLH